MISNLTEMLKDMRMSMGKPVFIEIFNKLGVKPDYSKASIQDLEDSLAVNFPEGNPITGVIIPMGLYLGETIVSTIPGTSWSVGDAKTIEDVAIELAIPGAEISANVYPFRRVVNFFIDHTDGLVPFYGMVEQTATQSLDMENIAEGEWVDIPGVGMVRKTTVATNHKN